MSLFSQSNEVKKEKLQDRLISLRNEYSGYLNRVCLNKHDSFTKHSLVIYLGFEIIDSEIHLKWRDISLPEDMFYESKYDNLCLKKGDGFIKRERLEFKTIKHELSLLNFEIISKKV